MLAKLCQLQAAEGVAKGRRTSITSASVGVFSK
jgi:hypothetical protein